MAGDVARRRALAAAAAALPLAAAGCKGISVLGTPPKAAPGVRLVATAMAVETQLIEHYGAVLGAVPGLAATLRPLLAQHHGHLARLRARLVVPAAGQPLPTPRAAQLVPAAVPGTAAAALGYLHDAEDAAANALLAHLTAAPPSLAQLLASISASEATHALVLGTAASQR